jgi:predicted DNA-binding transcriptional regulator YafY
MSVSMEKWIGRTVEIIYVDRKGAITQRLIAVRSVQGGRVRAYDYSRRAFRTFHADGILAQAPVGGHVC